MVSALLPLLLPSLAPLPGDGHPALEPPVRLEADGGPVDAGAYVGYAGPLLGDVIGDPLPDLVVGNYRGHLQLFENVGERGAPRFTARGLLEADGAPVEVDNW